MEQVKIVEILPTRIWIESDMMGSRHVMMQHDGFTPFTYASFFYDYAYTSNGGTLDAAESLAISLGATRPVEHLSREVHFPDADEAKKEIKLLQDYIDGLTEATQHSPEASPDVAP